MKCNLGLYIFPSFALMKHHNLSRYCTSVIMLKDTSKFQKMPHCKLLSFKCWLKGKGMDRKGAYSNTMRTTYIVPAWLFTVIYTFSY